MKKKLQKTIAAGMGVLLLWGIGCSAAKYYEAYNRFIPLRIEMKDVEGGGEGERQELTFRNVLEEDRSVYVINSETQHPDGEEATAEAVEALLSGKETEAEIYVSVWDYYTLKKPVNTEGQNVVQVVAIERFAGEEASGRKNEAFEEMKTLVTDVPDGVAPFAVLKEFEILDENASMTEEITRGEMVQLLINTLHLKNAAYGPREEELFSDVPEDHPNADAIYMAQAMKHVAGFGDGTFRPEKSVTAEQAVKLVVSMLGYRPVAEANGGYSVGYLQTSAQIGLTDGFTMSAGAPITRAEAAQLLEKAMYLPVMEQTYYKPGAEEYEIMDGTNDTPLIRFIDRYWRY